MSDSKKVMFSEFSLANNATAMPTKTGKNSVHKNNLNVVNEYIAEEQRNIAAKSKKIQGIMTEARMRLFNELVKGDARYNEGTAESDAIEWHLYLLLRRSAAARAREIAALPISNAEKEERARKMANDYLRLGRTELTYNKLRNVVNPVVPQVVTSVFQPVKAGTKRRLNNVSQGGRRKTRRLGH